MKVSKAIEILSDHVLWCDSVKEVDTLDALKLAIEALKRHSLATKYLRKGHPHSLPGETPENE